METRRADIFVHPDYFARRNEHLSKVYLSYEAAMQEALAKSSLPVLVHEPSEKKGSSGFDWVKPFDDDIKIVTKPKMGQPEKNADISRLIYKLSTEEIQRIVIHGSFLEICVDAFIWSMQFRLKEKARITETYGEPATWRLPETRIAAAVSLGHALSWDPSEPERSVRPVEVFGTEEEFNPNLSTILEGYIDPETTFYQLRPGSI